MRTILVTGFGPFPGAPFNPTAALAARLARLRRPGLADVRIVAHVFATGYAAVDRDLPELIERYKPDALLMFGLAARTTHLRIETRARNALALMPDAAGRAPARHAIAPGGPSALALPAPAQRLLKAARGARVPAAASRDAGRYLCNYLCWRAAETAARGHSPRLAAFVHVPLIRRNPAPRRKAKGMGMGKPRLAPGDLTRAGEALLMALAAAARR